MSQTHVPYEGATSNAKAREEITKILRAFGCESIGFMDEFDKHEVVLYFTHRGRTLELRASAKGWAQMLLKRKPWSYARKSNRAEYEKNALQQGQIAVNSMLRDWIKGQITAIECGILSFEAVFMPYMIATDGRPLIDHMTDSGVLPKALPPPSTGGVK